MPAPQYNDIPLDTGRAGNAQDKHVLCQPALAHRHLGAESEGEALLAEQAIPAVAASERDDLVVLGKVANHCLLRVAWPVVDNVPLGRERHTHRMQTLDKVAVVSHGVKDVEAHAGHDPHAAYLSHNQTNHYLIYQINCCNNYLSCFFFLVGHFIFF